METTGALGLDAERELAREYELMAALVVAATASSQPLGAEAIDHALGVGVLDPAPPLPSPVTQAWIPAPRRAT